MKFIINIYCFLLLSIFNLYAGGGINAVPEYNTNDKKIIEEQTKAENSFFFNIFNEDKKNPDFNTTYISEKKEDNLKLDFNLKKKDNNFYAGFGISVSNNIDYNNEVKLEKKALGFVARGGYNFNKYLGVEIRGLILAIKDKSKRISHLGIFAKGMIPITEISNLYTLLGVGKNYYDGFKNKNVIGYGAGLEIEIVGDKKDNLNINISKENEIKIFFDYLGLKRLNKKALTFHSFTSGINYQF